MFQEVGNPLAYHVHLSFPVETNLFLGCTTILFDVASKTTTLHLDKGHLNVIQIVAYSMESPSIFFNCNFREFDYIF